MNADMAMDICRKAVETGLLVMAPILLSALLAGVLVGLFQAVTQLQEPSLAFVPKLLALGLSLLLFGSWMLDRMRTFNQDIIQRMGELRR